MSKSKKKRKKVGNIPKNIKKSNAKKIVIAIASLAVIAAVIAVLLIVFSGNKNSLLTEKIWTSQKAYTASGDEAELNEVYCVNYTSYEGTLTFTSDSTFELWLTPGDPDDGTHKGTYEFDGEKISVSFDSEETAEFDVEYSENGKIECIKVPYANDYDSYKVYFY